MGQVVNFPTKSVRDWAEIERSIRDVLDSALAPPKMIDAVIARMKASFDQTQC